ECAVPPGRWYGANVYLHEFRWISGTIVLLRQVRAELGRPCHRAEVIRQRSATHPRTGVPSCIRAFPGGLDVAASKPAFRLRPSMLRRRSRALSTEMR